MKEIFELPLILILTGFEEGDLIAASELVGRAVLVLTISGEDLVSLPNRPGSDRAGRMCAAGTSTILVRRQGTQLTARQQVVLEEVLGRYAEGEATPQTLGATLVGFENTVLRDIAELSMRSLADSNVALASLRIECELLQIAFSQLESALHNKLATPAIFQSSPVDEWFAPDVAAGDTLRQLLPVVGAFVGTVTLFFKPSRDGGTGAVRLRLISAETDQELASWLVHYDEIHDGSADFVCRQILPANIGRVRLDLEWRTIYGQPPAVQLANAGAWNAGQCRAGASVLHGRMLALKLTSGASSVTSIRSPYAEWAKGNTLTVVGFDLMPSVLSKIKALTTSNTFEPVEVVKDVPYVQLHPPSAGETVAIVENCIPSGTREISAVVRVDALECRDVEFAMDVLIPDGPSKGTIEDEALARVKEMRWTKVAGGSSAIVALDLPATTVKGTHLVLATRMAVAGKNDFGWARWSDFSARVVAFRELCQPGSEV